MILSTDICLSLAEFLAALVAAASVGALLLLGASLVWDRMAERVEDEDCGEGGRP